MKVLDTKRRLGDLFAFKNGRAFKKEEWCSEGLPIIRIQNINNENGNFNYYAGEYSDDVLVQDGDLLFSWSGTVGSSFGPHIWQRGKGLLNQHIFAVSFKTEMNKRYAYYALEEITEEIEQQVSGAVGLVHITKEKLNDFTIPAPSIPEQQRIVGILDQAFDGIATAKASAEKNLQNAHALFESHLQSVFADAWKTGELVTLTDLATDITDGDHMPPPKAPSGVPFITIGNVAKDTRTIDFTDTFKVSREYFDRLKPNKKPQKGDVLYTVTGSFGIPVLLDEQREFCFQRHIGLVRPKPEVSSEWLYYLLMSPQIFKQANDGATGTAQKTVSLKLLRGFQVPLVPLERQRATAAKLKAVSEETQRLESLYQRKLAALDALKQSLLHQAFSGAL